MTVGSLFSGIGGLDLGFERAGFEIKWMCEQAEYPRKVLAKHWPSSPIHDDIRTLTDPEPVDVLIGGFPCQDNSSARTAPGRNGIRGAKSKLWYEYVRIIRHIRPAYVVVENVTGLLHAGRGFGQVLGHLAELGYDAEWDVLPASATGAPHQRARLWLVAYTHDEGKPDRAFDDEASVLPRTGPPLWKWPDPPRGLRMDDGPSSRVERNRATGNAVLPQVAEYVARCVRSHAERHGLWEVKDAA